LVFAWCVATVHEAVSGFRTMGCSRHLGGKPAPARWFLLWEARPRADGHGKAQSRRGRRSHQVGRSQEPDSPVGGPPSGRWIWQGPIAARAPPPPGRPIQRGRFTGGRPALGPMSLARPNRAGGGAPTKPAKSKRQVHRWEARPRADGRGEAREDRGGGFRSHEAVSTVLFVGPDESRPLRVIPVLEPLLQPDLYQRLIGNVARVRRGLDGVEQMARQA
jgi:hypothetical protein